MKKLLYAFLAVLLIAGAAYAISIPQSEVAETIASEDIPCRSGGFPTFSHYP